MVAVDHAARFTIENAKVRTYSDFLTNFDKNPQTGYLAQVVNEESVKQSIRNLVLTERTERFYRASTGCKIYSLLFDQIDPVTAMTIENTIRETIKNSEPRAILHSVLATPHSEFNFYAVTIIFSIATIPDQTFDISLMLRRVR